MKRIDHNVEFTKEEITILQEMVNERIKKLFPKHLKSHVDNPQWHFLCDLHDRLSNYLEDRMSEEEWEETYGDPEPESPQKHSPFPIDYRCQGFRKGY